MRRLSVWIAVIAIVALPGFAQAPPCTAGTLANVIGSGCAIGHLTFNFQNSFQGSIVEQDTLGNVQTLPLASSAVGFIPVQSGNQTGFLLTPNFFDSVNGTGLTFSQHNITFTYSVQVNGAFEILGESSTINGNITGVTSTSSDAIFAFDGQCFTNKLCISVQPRVASDPVNGAFNSPSMSATLEIPGLDGVIDPTVFTTEVDSFAIGAGEATLNSASFLYTVAPQKPLPRPARLNYKTIDVAGEQATFPEGINNHGQIGGVVQDPAGVFHGFLVHEDGSDLTMIDFPGATSTQVFGVNDRADIVGQYTDSAGVNHGFLLRNGSFSTIDFPNAVFNLAAQINNRGEIAGFYENADSSIHGYVLDDGHFTTIDDPNAPVFNGANNTPITQTEIFSINDRGDVVGSSLDQNGFPQSFLLAHGDFHKIAVPAAPGDTQASGVNDDLHVVGAFVDINVITHGFLQRDGGFRTVDFPGAVSSLPATNNAREQIVGFYSDTAGVFHGFLAERKDGDDRDDDDAGIASQSTIQNGASVIQPGSTSVPCIGRQPMHPDRTTGVMTCSALP